MLLSESDQEDDATHRGGSGNYSSNTGGQHTGGGGESRPIGGLPPSVGLANPITPELRAIMGQEAENPMLFDELLLQHLLTYLNNSAASTNPAPSESDQPLVIEENNGASLSENATRTRQVMFQQDQMLGRESDGDQCDDLLESSYDEEEGASCSSSSAVFLKRASRVSESVCGTPFLFIS